MLTARRAGDFEMAVKDRVERGETAEQAEAAARREFGNVALVKEVTRDMWGWASLERLGQDLRFGTRVLAKNPGFTLIAVLTLALGIGANTAIFSVTHAVLLRALPYQDADRLVIVWEKNQRTEQNSAFGGMSAFFDTRNSLSSHGEPEEVPGQITTDNLFSVLGVNAMLGRTFTPEDGKPGQNNVLVISHGLWQRRFGGDPNLIGRKVILNAVEHTVIGVLPRDFKWHAKKNSQTGRAAELWKPWAITNELRQFRGRFICAVARLKPGVRSVMIWVV